MTVIPPKPRPTRPTFIAPLDPCNVPLQRCSVPRAQASRRILIMRVGAHGDILMATPLLSALRMAWPDAHITWIVEHTERETIDANPEIDELIVWNGSFWKRMLRSLNYPLWLLRALQFRRELRTRHYDIFISLQPEEWPLLLRGIGAPLTIGVFDTFRRYYGNRPTSRRTHLYSHAYSHPNLPPHRIDQYLLPLDALCLSSDVSKSMHLGFTSEDHDAAQTFLRRSGCGDSERFVVLAPLTTWPSKCWPAERYAQLGDLLRRRQETNIILIGAARERAAIAAIAAQMKVQPIVAAGDLSFRQMAALVARAELVVSGDTGPMHVAAAVGTPSVALFGATSAAWYGPLDWRGLSLSHPVPCGPCDQKVCPLIGAAHMHCMHLITVEEALAAAEKLLASRTSGNCL